MIGKRIVGSAAKEAIVMKKLKTVITVSLVLAVFVCIGLLSQATQGGGPPTSVLRLIDPADCRTYLECLTRVHLEIAPDGTLHPARFEYLSVERKACNKDRFWCPRDLRCIKPSEREKYYPCPHDTMCLKRPLPKLGKLPLSYMDEVPNAPK